VACRCASEAVSAYRRPVPIDIGVGANCLTIERWRRGPTHWVIICALVGTKLRRDQLVRSACRERNEPLAKARSDANSGLDGGSAIFRHFKLESATGNWNLMATCGALNCTDATRLSYVQRALSQFRVHFSFAAHRLCREAPVDVASMLVNA